MKSKLKIAGSIMLMLASTYLIFFIPISKGAHLTGIYLGSEKQFDLLSAVAGRIVELNVTNGQAVREGDLAFRVQDESVKKEKDALNTKLGQLRSLRQPYQDRIVALETLYKQEYVSRRELERAEEEFRRLEIEIVDQNARLSELLTKEEYLYTIRVPRDGSINDVRVHRYQYVTAGSILAKIVPSSSVALFEMVIHSSQVGKVKAGDHVYIRFSSLPRQSSPLFDGVIVSIGAAPLLTESTSALTGKSAETQLYRAIVSVDKEVIDNKVNSNIVQGMQVEALVETGSHTIFRYIVTPFEKILRRALTED